ncbi:ssDNA-binding domain-containing protein [Lactobacillus delbrueckii subsp. lactis]|uniref:ArdC family protein n=1 Tax=Lactobacillus delbrueckii TaxID=1584 RepID=UPI001E4C45B2|nr:ArdC family protein [Lactobacillus delbrueckii]MCD5576442.1 ssDNA-binding domain-containing protein [Lactobacillus delbrueckii subsp. lactis]
MFEFPKSAIKNGPAAAMSAANGEKEGWQLVAPGLAWFEFKDPSESLYLVPSQRGKGREYAVITWEPGQRNSASVYLVNSISKLEKASRLLGEARRVITGQELAELIEPAKKTSQASENKPVKTSQAEAVKPAPKKPVQPADLPFSPGLVADKAGKITIASLLNAGKKYVSYCLPADFSSRFKKYSADNQLLLYLQGGPDLPAVRTYRGWLKEGRQVTKGQHGLKILAPRMVIKEDGTKAIDGLRLVTLFSVKQTELASQEA